MSRFLVNNYLQVLLKPSMESFLILSSVGVAVGGGGVTVVAKVEDAAVVAAVVMLRGQFYK